MTNYIAGALLIIASYYFHIEWILYVGILLLLYPVVLVAIAIAIGILAGIFGN